MASSIPAEIRRQAADKLLAGEGQMEVGRWLQSLGYPRMEVTTLYRWRRQRREELEGRSCTSDPA